jgi:predicted enzyme related to lactoylglutathione lyase
MAQNQLSHFDILVSDTSVSRPFYQNIFPEWSFNTGATPETVDPTGQSAPNTVTPKGALPVRNAHYFVPFFEVASVPNVKTAVEAQMRLDNEVEILEEDIHPVTGKAYIVFTDPDGILIGAIEP